jgi:hypothetical protein
MRSTPKLLDCVACGKPIRAAAEATRVLLRHLRRRRLRLPPRPPNPPLRFSRGGSQRNIKSRSSLKAVKVCRLMIIFPGAPAAHEWKVDVAVLVRSVIGKLAKSIQDNRMEIACSLFGLSSFYIIGISIYAATLPVSPGTIWIVVLLPPAEWARSTRHLIERTGAHSILAILFSILVVWFAVAEIDGLTWLAEREPSFHWLMWIFFALWFLCPLLVVARYIFGLFFKSSQQRKIR